MNRFRRSTVLLMALMAAWGWIGSAQLQAHTGHSEQVRQISLQISRHRASHQKKGSSAILVSLLLRRGDMYRRMRRFRRSLSYPGPGLGRRRSDSLLLCCRR